MVIGCRMDERIIHMARYDRLVSLRIRVRARDRIKNNVADGGDAGDVEGIHYLVCTVFKARGRNGEDRENEHLDLCKNVTV